MRRQKQWDEPIPTYAPREPLGKRLGRFVGLMGAIFAIAAAVIVTQKLSHDSLALLIGLSCGVAAMLPTIALGVLVWRREDARRSEREAAQAQLQMAQPYAPPVIVVSPQGVSNDPYGRPALTSDAQPWPWAAPQSQRNFTIVGGEE
ncbi:MAG: hypothetical protein JXC32_04850 [Anaerolineae bacterium]|nr:hypothetical protein [Anaerolineae bacterium]